MFFNQTRLGYAYRLKVSDELREVDLGIGQLITNRLNVYFGEFTPICR